MRAIWSGEIAFGLVTIPTKLYSGTRDLTPKFHLIHKACGTRVQMVRRCPKCEKDLGWDEIDKSYEVSKSEHARFTTEELTAIEADETKGVIEIVEFVDPGEVDLAYIEKSYWVGPSGKSSHSFLLLRSVLEKLGLVAVARVAIRSRTRLALLRPRDHLFSLDMMRFADELVDSKDIETSPAKAPSEKELKLAETLVDQLTSRFDPEKHPDEYRARVNALIDERVEGQPETDVKGAHRAKGQGGKVIDLSELLARSLKSKGGPKHAPASSHPRVKRAASGRGHARPAKRAS